MNNNGVMTKAIDIDDVEALRVVALRAYKDKAGIYMSSGVSTSAFEDAVTANTIELYRYAFSLGLSLIIEIPVAKLKSLSNSIPMVPKICIAWVMI